MESPTQKIIEKSILDNYIEYQYLFLEFQSKFLAGLYSRYQNVESGNLALYYAKQTHQDILRQKNYDLNFNISYKEFWKNHYDFQPRKISIIKIASDTSLPKETARRKILELTKQKVLNKKNGNIGWLPSEQYKKNYNLFITEEVKGLAKLVSFVCKKLDNYISSEEAVKEIEDKFSFYLFHYLGAQLEYLRLWSKQLKDLELCLIFIQVAHLFAAKTKEKNLSHKDVFDDSSLLKEFISASISATSVADITKIPRATCIRKLEILVKLKILSKDKISKRYYIIPDFITAENISPKITKKVVKIFSEFFFICIRAINSKNSN
jgi:Fic family protein